MHKCAWRANGRCHCVLAREYRKRDSFYIENYPAGALQHPECEKENRDESNEKHNEMNGWDNTDGDNNGNVSHSGIYIGNGEFIHASSSKGKVIISNMSSGFYSNAYVNARRVL